MSHSSLSLLEGFLMDAYGIPTVYKGRQYRSRLEARWAAFFDLLGWRYEYEPFDRRGWTPDFLILGGRDEVLVEVKPVAEFPWNYAERVIRILVASTMFSISAALMRLEL